ncbi:MAG TPA: hypothetical protein VF026_17015 [Ktedonobacteraceae bacterium]
MSYLVGRLSDDSGFGLLCSEREGGVEAQIGSLSGFDDKRDTSLAHYLGAGPQICSYPEVIGVGEKYRLHIGVALQCLAKLLGRDPQIDPDFFAVRGTKVNRPQTHMDHRCEDGDVRVPLDQDAVC